VGVGAHGCRRGTFGGVEELAVVVGRSFIVALTGCSP